MKLSLNWLKDFVDINESPQELAQLLTMAGLEVEGVEPLGRALEDIVVGKILSVKKHPKADRLFICQVDTGKDSIPVVCGASNVKEGAMIPMALPDTRLPGGMVVKEALLRGERSVGMLLAEDEMGLTDDHTGIMILSDDLEPGIELSSAIPLEDFAFDISLTPNRPDCASVIGIAREVAALTGQKVKMPHIEIRESGPPITELASVTIEDTKGCPRYAAGMIQGIRLGSSPFWMRYRLYVSGVRAINNVVDITNYVLLEMGQPLHAFDYDRLKDGRIVVSRAKEGDLFSTLDGQTHSLSKEHLMICDGERPVALAGIMGGLNSEIFAGSKNVLIESAYFDPVTIRRGSKSLGLSTEASYRFERGIDVGGVKNALKRALMLISEMGGGNINKGIIDIYPEPYESPLIDLRVEKTNSFLGTNLSKDGISSYLRALEMEVHDLADLTIQVKPPTFRVDISREVDLMEEVARMKGYDNIPVTSPFIRPSEESEPHSLTLQDKVSEIMAGLGFSEVITYSFISPDSADMLGAEDKSPLRSFVHLENPLTMEQSVLRTSMAHGLLSTIKENIDHDETDLKLYEWGKIFINKDSEDLPHEKLSFAAIMTGLFKNRGWHREKRNVDFYDAKGYAEVFLRSLGLKEATFKGGQPSPWYHSYYSCGIYLSNSRVGSLGQVDADVIKRYDIKAGSTYLFEVDIEALLEEILVASVTFEPYSKFPAVIRDLSLIMDRKIESIQIRQIIEKEGKGLVESVDIFDVYEGEKIDPSKKAISFRICYRSKDSTLDGKLINRIHEATINSIRKKTGGRLRDG